MAIKRKCVICGKILVVTLDAIGNRRKNKGNIPYSRYSSEEGVLFTLDGHKAWFCNACWGEIRSSDGSTVF